ncbi:DUF262 domain-containing protein [Microbacterium sp. cx-55]|uniref:GmrSD restriction endonuclease domain-containing protein n=1 Tax=Microbacterium sp. cx-55 TaxID=2875948 RepID=UPI001CBD234D|nr:DUF262 domain-containing protein [Microbacterium sp. cx-55]MBZ4487415.1 DUF262 domain-containing protein [Microbacterium sp. cx-55]UGB35435.1 DUF262 domain-containing protein [Microbacterium sp. cx-55]
MTNPEQSNQWFLEATHHTVSWFWKRHKAEELELKPPYQRNPVWQEKQQAALMDTILRGYPVPELYLQTRVDADGDETYIVVDGQQRIRACLTFIAGDVPLGDESGTLAGSYFDDLTDDQRRQVFQYKFVVRELPSLADAEIRDIFGRLNRNNIALNAQELRHSTYWGEFIKTMESLSSNDFWVTSGVFTANDIRRMLDIEYVSELAVSLLYGLQNKKSNLDKYYRNFESEFPDRETAVSTFSAVLGELSQLLSWPTDLRWKKKTDFYSLFLVLADRVTDLPFDRKTRADIAQKLASLSTAIDAYIKDPEAPGPVAQARGYGRAAARAASDLANRRARSIALSSYLFDLPYELEEPEELEELEP